MEEVILLADGLYDVFIGKCFFVENMGRQYVAWEDFGAFLRAGAGCEVASDEKPKKKGEKWRGTVKRNGCRRSPSW